MPASLRAAIRKSLGPGAYSRPTELSAKDGAPNDEAGYSVALSATGATAVVGAPRAGGTGAAYVYSLRSGPESHPTELTAANQAKAGAIGTRSYAGAAFVFTGRGHCSCR